MRRIAAVVVVAGALLGTFAGVPASAASVGCGSSCDHKNPQTWRTYTSSTSYYYCADDAVVIDTKWSGKTFVELRYSPRCRTVWARSNALVTEACGAAIYSWNPDHSDRTSDTMPYTTGVGWTPMLDDRGFTGSAALYCGGTNYAWTVEY